MNVVVDHDVVAHLDVVAEGEGDVLEQAEVVAGLGEEVVGEHLAEPQGEGDVVGHRRRVELPPEPLEVFRALVLAVGHRLDLGVVLALEGGVAGVVPLQTDPLGRRDGLAGLPALVGRPVAVEVHEYVLDHVTGILVAGEALVDLVDERP